MLLDLGVVELVFLMSDCMIVVVFWWLVVLIFCCLVIVGLVGDLSLCLLLVVGDCVGGLGVVVGGVEGVFGW